MKKPPDDWGQVCESAGTDLVQPEEAAELIAGWAPVGHSDSVAGQFFLTGVPAGDSGADLFGG
jgi:hypothetical protein